ncbi:hypothetical protein ACROYT_G014128 [Oculina patagonica]
MQTREDLAYSGTQSQSTLIIWDAQSQLWFWTDAKDFKLLQAIGAEGVFVGNRVGSREIGQLWQRVATSFVHMTLPVAARSVRDGYNILAKKWREKVSKEEKESGGGDEHQTELEALLEKLVELERGAEKAADTQEQAKKSAAEQDKKRANEMREQAAELFGQTRKKNGEAEKEGGQKGN